MKDWVIALISGLAGSVIGAIATSWATYHFTAKHRLELDEKQKKNLMKAFGIELSTLWETYMAIIGKDIEVTNDFDKSLLTGMTQSHQNYLIVYDNSANLIGLLNPEVAEEVIKTYTNIKAFLDELMHYGRLKKEYLDNIHLPPDKNSGARPAYMQMEGYYSYLRNRHVVVKKMIEDTILVLNNAI